MRSKRIVAPTLLVVLVCYLLVQLPLAIADRTSGYDFIDPIIDIRGILAEHYVEEPDHKRMQLAAIRAMIETLNDRHTVFVPPSRERDFNKDLRGTYVGIGAEVNVIDDYLTIVSPMDDSPALESGVLAGDVVLEIEGVSTYQMPVEECIDRLLGEPNTKVTIKVRHLTGVEETISITRRQIVARTVKGLVRNADAWHHCVDPETNVAYVRVTQFNGTTTTELRQTLEQLVEGGMNGLILDLRDNPGGALPAAIEMADMFLEAGDILSVRPRNGRGRTWSATAGNTVGDFPIVVMVNGQSASASEIVAGALQDNGRAKVLGTRTFGKGSVQEVRELDYNRGTLKYTNAYYYLPSGRNLHRRDDDKTWGVDPDPGLVITETDEAYIAHRLARRPFEVIRDRDDELPDCFSPGWIRENLKDEQLASAVEVLTQRVAAGDWMQVTDINPAVAALDNEMDRLGRARSRLLQQLEEIEQSMSEREQLAEAAGKEPVVPDDVDLTEGTITLRDKAGNVIGEFRIADADAALALNTMRLLPIKKDE